jgi:O-methyltransferase
MSSLISRVYRALSIPFGIYVILNSKKIHQAYGMSLYKKFNLGLKMFLNCRRITTASPYVVHLAMALKILETPPDLKGDVIECGTYKGGSAANLSLVCRITGRKLKIYDSFEGLPAGEKGDRAAKYYQKGEFAGTLEEVKLNIRRYGAIECCEFVKGWFNETLPKLDSPVLLAWIDVDLESSLHTCVKNIWPNLVSTGFLFIDEALDTDHVSLFYSEAWWHKYFNCNPPGLIGAGTGLPLGQYYIGPLSELNDHPLQIPGTGAYAKKGMSGHWEYYSD